MDDVELVFIQETIFLGLLGVDMFIASLKNILAIIIVLITQPPIVEFIVSPRRFAKDKNRYKKFTISIAGLFLGLALSIM